MAARAPGRQWPARFALGSLILHGLLLSLGVMRRAPVPPTAPPTAAVSELEVEMLAPLSEPVSEDSLPRAPSPHEPAPAARSAPTSAAPRPLIAGEAEGPAEISAVDPDRGHDAGAPVAAGPSAASPARGPGLSLAQLGVGEKNSFLVPADPAVVHAEKAARVQRRLDRALAQGLHDQDTARGRGAGSPVIRTLEAAVYASTAPLNGGASFIFVIDSEGKVLSSTLGAASGDREAWVRVARKAAQSLAQRKLPVPRGKSVRLTVAVSSHLELPSGADPGTAVDVLGIPLKKGGGPRSSKVDLLNPTRPFSPLSLAGDPADIGQNARRMVHAHVVSEELL